MLDSLFIADSKTSGREQSDISGLIGQYAHGNEPSHHIAYLYDYAGQPWKTQFYVAKVLNELYNNSSSGYQGNEDCGQMSAWYIISALGFYPVDPVSGNYVVGTPLFDRAVVDLGDGKSLVLEAKRRCSIAIVNPSARPRALSSAAALID